eukprot:3120154-Prymnesium_polylepis.2
MYSIPNLFMTAISGVAIDRAGLKLCGLVLVLTVALGTAVVAAAPSLPLPMVPTMLAGRFIVGVGGESLVTWQQSACIYWFAGAHEVSENEIRTP